MLFPLLSLFPLLFIPATARVYTGFAYGAFWTVAENCKHKADFVDSFNFAKKLSTPVEFDSARLFTTRQCGSQDSYTEAIDAAIDTKTNILLGFYLSAPKPGQVDKTTNAQMLNWELTALEKAFTKYGQRLADLIIGLSVGNEDILNFNGADSKFGASEDTIMGNLRTVRERINNGPLSKFMKGKPIGHTDIPQYAGKVLGDFIGMNAYPYWNGNKSADGKAQYMRNLDQVKQKSGGQTPIWLTEVGWPVADDVSREKDLGNANVESLQRYWRELGCSLFGKYNTFWFQLLKDTEVGQPDWSIVDSNTKKPRIDLSCPGSPNPGNGPSSIEPAASKNTAKIHASSSAPAQTPTALPPQAASPVGTSSEVTTTITVFTTVAISTLIRTRRPSANPPPISRPPASESLVRQPTQTTGCITVADISSNGQYISVASNPAGADGKCSSPFPYTGMPYTSPAAGSAQPSSTLAQNPPAISHTSSTQVSGPALPLSTDEACEGPSSSAMQRRRIPDGRWDPAALRRPSTAA